MWQSVMKIAAHTFLWTGHFSGKEDRVFEEAAACGFDGVEIALDAPEAIDWNNVARAQARHKLRIFLCATQPTGLSLASGDRAVRAAAVDHMRSIMEVSRDLGSELVTGPFLNPVGAFSGAGPTNAENAAVLDSLKTLADVAEREGMRLALEPLNRFQGYLLSRVDDGIALCRQTGSERIGLLLDLFHMNIEEMSAAAAIRRAGERCFHVHVSACDRGVPGTDDFDWGSLRDALGAIDYAGWIVVETFCFSEADAMAKAHLWHPARSQSAAAAASAIAHVRKVFHGQPLAPRA